MAKYDDPLNQEQRVSLEKRLGEIQTARADRLAAQDLEERKGNLRTRVGKGLVSGAGQAVAGIPQALGIAQGLVDDTPLQERSLYKAGEAITSFVDEDLLGVTPEEQATFGYKFGQGLGQVGGMVVPGAALGKAGKAGQVAGHALGLTSGVGLSGAEGAQDYIQTREAQGKPIDPQELDKTAFANSLRGVLEYITPAKGLRAARGSGQFATKTLGGKAAHLTAEGLKGLTREGAQEAFDQLALNAIAKGYVKYDPERNLFEDLQESAEVGGAVGATFNTIMGALGLRARGKYEAAVSNKKAADVVTARNITQGEEASLNPDTGTEFDTSQLSKAAKKLEVFQKLQDTAVLRNQGEPVTSGFQKKMDSLIKDLETKYLRGDAADPVARSEAVSLIDNYKGEGYSQSVIDRFKADEEAAKEEKTAKKKSTDEKKVSKVEEDVTVPTQEKTLFTWLDENGISRERFDELRISEEGSADREAYLDLVDAFKNNEKVTAEDVPSRVESIQQAVEAGKDEETLQNIIDTQQQEIQVDAAEEQVPQASDTPVDQLPQEQPQEEIPIAETQDTLEDEVVGQSSDDYADSVTKRAEDVVNSIEPDRSPGVLEVSQEEKDQLQQSTERLSSVLGPITPPAPIRKGREITEEELAADNKAMQSLQDGDILTSKKTPFAGKGPATRAANKATKSTGIQHEAVQVSDSSWVARPVEATSQEEQVEGSPTTDESLIPEEGRKTDPRSTLYVSNDTISPQNLATLEKRWTNMVQTSGNVKKVQDLTKGLVAFVESNQDWNSPTGKEIYKALVKNLTNGSVDPFKSKEENDIAEGVAATQKIIEQVKQEIEESDNAGDVSPHEANVSPVSKAEEVAKEVVDALPEHVDVTDSNDINQRISDINDEIAEIDVNIEELSTYDADTTEERAKRRSLVKERSNLQKSLKSLEKGKDIGITEEELKDIQKNEGIQDFDDNFSAASDVEIEITEPTSIKREFDKIKERLSKFNSDIEVVFYTSPEDVPKPLASLLENSGKLQLQAIMRSGIGQSWKGYHVKHPSNGTTYILMNSKKFDNIRDFQETFFHEVVGHYGMRRVFGKKWESFLDKIVNTNEFLRDRAYNLSRRWYSYDISPSDNPGENYSFFHKGEKKQVVVNKKGMQKLVDELIAEEAKKFVDEDFRGSVDKLHFSKFRKILNYIRHIFRSVFGGYSQKITEDDILLMLSESYNMVFNGDNKLYLEAQKYMSAGKYDLGDVLANENTRDSLIAYISRVSARFEKRGSIPLVEFSRGLGEAGFTPTERVAIGRVIENAFNGSTNVPISRLSDMFTVMTKLSDAQERFQVDEIKEDGTADRDTLREGDFGRLNDTWWSSHVDRIMRKVRYNKAINLFTPMGNMPNERNYDSINASAKGKISRGDDLIRRLKKGFGKIKQPSTKHAIFQYFTTKDASIDDVPEIGTDMKNLLVKSKQTIESLGQNLVDLGYLSTEVYEENKGMYLPTRYLKYIDTYAGSGKRPSFLNYLKSKNEDISEADKVALGRIEDPEFLIVDSIATMSRDVALLNLFKMISAQSSENKYFWILQDEARVKVGGHTINLVDINDHIKHYQLLISDGIGGLHNFTQQEHESLVELKERAEILKVRGEENLKESVKAAMVQRGAVYEDISEEALDTYLHQNYAKMPNDYVYGALRGRYVRKEIYQDLTDTFEANQVDSNSLFSRFFSPGGYVETANHFWKFMKVPANIPSWFRNGIGNGILLDISTNTNSVKLGKMVFDTFKSIMEGDPHEFSRGPNFRKSSDTYRYVRWAMANGLFGTTFSTQELYLVQQQYQHKYKRLIAKNALKEKKGGMLKGKLQGALWWSQDSFYALAEVANHSYGLLEGIFKTVRLQDHMEQWEKQNNRKIEDLNDEEFHAVLFEAVNDSNDAIFDYSKIPNFLRMMRRYPLGAPFLTFTYKAIPAVVKGVAYHPQKFIKYAAFPYIMSQMFLAANDMDDDDLEEIKRKMPLWMKDRNSIYLLPWKDSNGNWQAMDFGYFFPWEIFQNYGLHVKNHFDTTRPGMSALEMAAQIPKELGFASGPLPSMINAFYTNTDDFTGREIVTTGAPQSQQFNELFGYLHTMWAPTWLTSQGALGKLMDEFGIERTPFNTGQELDRYGNDKATVGQASARLVGANVYPVNTEVTNRQNIAGFKAEMLKLTKARAATMKNRNYDESTKARLLKNHNEQIKRLRQKQRQYLEGEA